MALDENLRRETKARIDEVHDLITRQPANWQNQVDDRLELLRNVLGVALSGQEKPVSEPLDPTKPVADYREGNPDQPALDVNFWDRPDEEIQKDGPGLVEIWAVKNAALRDGYQFKHPAPPESRDHWKVYRAGDPVPPGWDKP